MDAVVEGRHDTLKERNIGVGVFGRDAAYDTAQDAVVRNAAVEVRKRLAQYYLEPEHHSELRIELPLGTYVPVFPNGVDAAAAPDTPAPVITRPQPHRTLWLTAAAAAVLIAAVAVTLWLNRRTPTSELDAFWAPLFRDHEVIQLCVGQPGRLYRFAGPRRDELDHLIQGGGVGSGAVIAPGELEWIAPNYLYLRDAFAAARIAAWIQSKGQPYRLISVTRTTYSQLRGSPMVAIGAFDNPWALRITAELRFVFDHRTINGEVYNCVNDRRNPNATGWKVARSVGERTTEDYAIVTRVFDPTTERTAVSAAGIENYGTFAAGEFVTDPAYLGAALVRQPKDWRRKNLQIVLGTKIIDGAPGPPRVLAENYW